MKSNKRLCPAADPADSAALHRFQFYGWSRRHRNLKAKERRTACAKC